MLISVTRLRLARWADLIHFMKLSGASIRQAIADPKCRAGATYLGPGLTFWTATVWEDEQSMKLYVRTGSHRETLPWLSRLCTEGATAHFTSADGVLPDRATLLARLTAGAKFFRVESPSAAHRDQVVPPVTPWIRSRFK